jgi:hypothetical protein
MKLWIAALLLAVAFAPAAEALTLDTKGMTNSDGSARFSDPDKTAPFSSNGSGSGDGSSTTIYKNGNSSLSFGVGRPEARTPGSPFRPYGPRPFLTQPGFGN